MKLSETAKLLTFASLYDGRDPDDEAAVRAWHELVADLPYEDAEQAVREHFTVRRERLMPSDVIARVRAVQARRLGVEAPEPDARALGVDPDDAPAYRAALYRWRQQVAAGLITHQPAEIEGPPR